MCMVVRYVCVCVCVCVCVWSLLHTSDAADEEEGVALSDRRIKKKKYLSLDTYA